MGRLVARRSGFTIVELLVVLAIIGVFATVAVPRFFGFINRFRLNQVTNTIFTEMQSLRVEAVARERCMRARFDLDENRVFYERARVGDGSSCGVGTVPFDEWEAVRSPTSVPQGVDIVSAGVTETRDESYVTYNRRGNSGTVNMGDYWGVHFTTLSPEPVDECDYRTIAFPPLGAPSGMLVDFKVYDGHHTLADPPRCVED